MSELKQATDEPVIPGHYWFRGHAGNAMEHYDGPVRLDECGQVELLGVDGLWNAHHFEGMWFWPLEPPQ